MFLTSALICGVLGVSMIIYPIRPKPGAPWPWTLLNGFTARLLGVLMMGAAAFWYWMSKTQ
jgi:hypothetical protein